MVLQMLKGKIHRARVTQANLDYEGSMAIDALLMEAAGILPNERIEIYNVSSGHRLATYAIQAEPGSGVISANGAAARLIACGDLVIICAYAGMDEYAARKWSPAIVMVDENNRQK